jgi:predicted  nucleic acid-binding Zn-ribbon protein
VNPYVYGGVPFAPTVTTEQELEGLKQQAEYFQDALDEIKERMKELESQAAKTKK